jgi:hypothetical protein
MSADNRDPFALGGDQRDGGDARVLSLFNDWIDAHRAADAERLIDAEDQIAGISGGAVSLAIKTYIWHHRDLCNWVPDSASLAYTELFEGTDDPWEADPIVSILRDAAKLVPEIGELAAAVIHEDAPLIDADIKIQWCRACLANKPTFLHEIEVRTKLSKMFDRVANTEAKTPRGREIKARHAGAIGAEQEQNAELRRHAEALAAEYDAPLADGDAGLIEAEQRFHKFEPRRVALEGEMIVEEEIH